MFYNGWFPNKFSKGFIKFLTALKWKIGSFGSMWKGITVPFNSHLLVLDWLINPRSVADDSAANDEEGVLRLCLGGKAVLVGTNKLAPRILPKRQARSSQASALL